MPVNGDLENGFAEIPQPSSKHLTSRHGAAWLQAYQETGADVLYAPGLTRLADIRSVVESVDRPVNVLAMAKTPDVSHLGSIGVGRISVGGAFTFAAFDAAAAAARELLDQGTYGYTSRSKTGKEITMTTFGA